MSHARKKSSFDIYQRWAVQNFIVQFVPMTCRSSFCVGQCEAARIAARSSMSFYYRNKEAAVEARKRISHPCASHRRNTYKKLTRHLMQVPFQQLRPEFRRSFQASLSIWIWLNLAEALLLGRKSFLEDVLSFRFEWVRTFRHNSFVQSSIHIALAQWLPLISTSSQISDLQVLQRSRRPSKAKMHPLTSVFFGILCYSIHSDSENHFGRWFVTVIEM